MSVTISEKTSGTKLAHAEAEADAVKYEGNWYFLPAAVERDKLIVTDRTYTCPFKGTCHWVDYAGPGGDDRQGRGVGLRKPEAGARSHKGPLRVLRRHSRGHPARLKRT